MLQIEKRCHFFVDDICSFTYGLALASAVALAVELTVLLLPFASLAASHFTQGSISESSRTNAFDGQRAVQPGSRSNTSGTGQANVPSHTPLLHTNVAFPFVVCSNRSIFAALFSLSSSSLSAVFLKRNCIDSASNGSRHSAMHSCPCKCVAFHSGVADGNF